MQKYLSEGKTYPDIWQLARGILIYGSLLEVYILPEEKYFCIHTKPEVYNYFVIPSLYGIMIILVHFMLKL